MSGPATSLSNLILEKANGEVASVGGRIIRFVAALNLNIGDAVFLSSAGLATKSTTDTDYVTYLGVVVGGESFNSQDYLNDYPGIIGSAVAAATGEAVLVQVDGVAYVQAQGDITAGLEVIPSAVASGKVSPATGTDPVVLGVALEAFLSGEVGKILVRLKA